MIYGTLSADYPATSKLLHWLVAICLLVTIPIAIWMANTDNNLYNFHKSLGVLILVLML